MTAEGRLARGKANYEANIFLNNSETLAYIDSIKVEKPKIKESKKDASK